MDILGSIGKCRRELGNTPLHCQASTNKSRLRESQNIGKLGNANENQEILGNIKKRRLELRNPPWRCQCNTKQNRPKMAKTLGNLEMQARIWRYWETLGNAGENWEIHPCTVKATTTRPSLRGPKHWEIRKCERELRNIGEHQETSGNAGENSDDIWPLRNPWVIHQE